MEDEEPLTPAVKSAVNFFNNLNKPEIKPKPRTRVVKRKYNAEKKHEEKSGAMNLINHLNGETKHNSESKTFRPRYKGGSKEKLIVDEYETNVEVRSKPDLVLEINDKPKLAPKPKPRTNISKWNQSKDEKQVLTVTIPLEGQISNSETTSSLLGDTHDDKTKKIETFNSVLILKSLNPVFTTNQTQFIQENSYTKSITSLNPSNDNTNSSVLIVKSDNINAVVDTKPLKNLIPETDFATCPTSQPKIMINNAILSSGDIVIPRPKFPRNFQEKIRNSQSLEDLRIGEIPLEQTIKRTPANTQQSMECLLELEKDKSAVGPGRQGEQHFVQAFKKSKRFEGSLDSRGKKVKSVEPYDTFDVGSAVFRDVSVVMVGDDCSDGDFFGRKVSSNKRRGTYQKVQVNVGQLDERSDAFLEPYLQGLGDRQSPGVGAPSPSPPPACRIGPFLLPGPASRSPSRESLISSNGGSDAGSEDSGDTGYGAACDIGLLERLSRSHPIWFLPGIQRAGAFHLLQGKEEGCFVVRQSSQPDTMALSVRLPPDKGPYIEHYLIQSTSGRLGLETSENRFDNIPSLIAHYATCCDELPVQLTLPKAIREARSRQQLSSYALLGQEFWRYSPPPSASSSPDADLVLNLNPLMSTFKTAEPSTPVPNDQKPARPNTLNLINNVDPKNESRIEPIKCIPSFKNEQVSKTPPPPPPRWSKPTTPQSNITVTTTVTFSVNSQSPRTEQPPSSEMICDTKRMSPEGQTSTMSSKGSSIRRGPETVTSPNGSVLSPNSDSNSLMTPDTLSPLSVTKTARTSRRAKQKVSKHYQESDILESPTVYYRSAVGDKISDYEDLWSNEHGSQKNKTTNLASPDLLQHTGTIVSLNNNILSPTDSQTTGSQHSHCSTPNGNQNISSNLSIQSPISESNGTLSQDTTHSPKQNSPFYAEPADSLAQNPVPRRVFNRNIIPVQQRHSNPAVLLSHSPLSPGFERNDPADFNGTMSSSVDNLSPKQRLTGIRKPEVKAVLPPSIKPKVADTWQVDNSWKFVGNDADMSVESSEADYDSDWPVTVPNFHISSFVQEHVEKRISIQEMISREFPDIRMSNDTTDEELSRMSAYDNVDDRRTGIPRAPPSEISELTEFSDPWAEITPGVSNTEAEDSFSENCNPPPKFAPINRKKSFKDRMDPLLFPRLEALRSRDQGDSRTVGAAIRNFALELASDKSTTFAQNIDNFIACTKDSRVDNPEVVMRNMRQFMSGMKNYLVKHGERGFDKEVERERSKLKSTEFLNIDAILEGVLHCLVVTPLKSHLHKLFINKYTKTGAIRLLADNIQYANTRPVSELAIKPKITLPNEVALQTIQQYLNRLQAADSPLEKLEYLFAAIATIFNSVKTTQLTGSGRSVTLGADDFLPLFVWVLVKTNFVAAEIEAEYMWGLLHPSLLSGEGGYYLTTLLSAVHVLKNFKESNEENVKNNLKSDVSVLKSVLKVVVPDELHGSILTKTLPARPHMTTKEVCKIIAHKARITNPQDFALYRLVDGEETLLGDNECPQDFMCEGKHVMLAYKRIDAKIAWPKQQSTN